MSRLVQRQFKKHPVVGAVLLGLRWFCWTAVGFPVGSLVLAVWVLGGSLLHVSLGLVAAVAVESGLRVRGPVWYRSWSLGCRFACVWPSLWASMMKDLVKASASEAAVDVGRSVLSCPWISLVPRVSGRVVSWRVRVPKGSTMAVLEDLATVIAASSKQIHLVEFDHRLVTDSRAVMSVSFGDVLGDVGSPSWA